MDSLNVFVSGTFPVSDSIQHAVYMPDPRVLLWSDAATRSLSADQSHHEPTVFENHTVSLGGLRVDHFEADS